LLSLDNLAALQAVRLASGQVVERALDLLRHIQHLHIRINATHSVTGLSTMSHQQAQVFNALNVKKPIAFQQLTLL
jgi:hypothetical protein